MIDPLHLEARMEIVPSPCLVGVDNASSGDATANDCDRFGLVFYDHGCRLAAPLPHYYDATALAVLAFAPTPINPRSAMIFRPDIAAKPAAVDLNDPT